MGRRWDILFLAIGVIAKSVGAACRVGAQSDLNIARLCPFGVKMPS
jgi:hypothetical protein